MLFLSLRQLIVKSVMRLYWLRGYAPSNSPGSASGLQLCKLLIFKHFTKSCFLCPQNLVTFGHRNSQAHTLSQRGIIRNTPYGTKTRTQGRRSTLHLSFYQSIPCLKEHFQSSWYSICCPGGIRPIFLTIESRYEHRRPRLLNSSFDMLSNWPVDA